MITRPVLRSLALSSLLLCTAPAWAETPSQSFLKDAIQSNLAAIAVGKLAAQKGGSAAIKAYGQTLVDDHNKANAAATDAAKSLGVAVPTASNPEQVALHDHLATEPAKTFDTDFVNGMLQAHAKDISSYQAAAANDKDAAGAYASQELPVLQRHLTDAQDLAKGLGL